MMNALLRFFNKDAISQFDRVPFIAQRHKGGDGLACIAMLFRHHEISISTSTLHGQYQQFRKGMGLSDMIDIFATHGLDSHAMHCTLKELSDLSLPLILHWDSERFAVLSEITEDEYIVLDPASQKLAMRQIEFERHFSEVILQISARATSE